MSKARILFECDETLQGGLIWEGYFAFRRGRGQKEKKVQFCERMTNEIDRFGSAALRGILVKTTSKIAFAKCGRKNSLVERAVWNVQTNSKQRVRTCSLGLERLVQNVLEGLAKRKTWDSDLVINGSEAR